MAYLESYYLAEQAADHARKTMSSLQIFPYPDNFEVWYAFHAELDADLQTALTPVAADPKKFDPESYDAIKSSYLREGEREAFDAATNGLDAAISETLRSMESASDNAKAYGDQLTDFGGRLDTADPASLKAYIFKLAQDTREMLQRNQAMEQELQSSRESVTELKKSLDEARMASRTDGLTQLANRRAFDETMERAMRDAVESGDPLSLLVLDIDHFKKFNDRHGHRIGDEVLKLVGHVLRTSVRSDDLAARYGGEEFCVLMRSTPAEVAFELAEKIRIGVGAKALKNGRTGESYGRVTTSIGCASALPGDTPIGLFERADAALYLAKRSGRDQTCVDEKSGSLAAAG